ncbi:MAG: hypothetical protein GX644_14265, partial [Limnobacter sp.]|nr:hypothetical protein [Limnobacter sp.]
MKPLASLAIPGAPDRRIELLQGDLSAPGAAHRFDLLVVSAFPDNYVPTEGSLIGALHRRGVSLAELAARKEIDLRQHFSCWLSGELPSPDLGFRRILCFEPQVRGEPPSVVGDIFR